MTKDETPPKSPQDKLREAVEKRKAAAQAGRGGIPGKRSSEAAASHRSLSKSKPALSK